KLGEIAETTCAALPDILGNAQFPSTLSGLAAISSEFGYEATSSALLGRYLELAPDAPDRNHVINAVIAGQVSGLLDQALEKTRVGNHSDGYARVAAALKHDPGISVPTHGDTAQTIRAALPDILG